MTCSRIWISTISVVTSRFLVATAPRNDTHGCHSVGYLLGCHSEHREESAVALNGTGHHAGIVQLLSSFVGAITSRLWFAPGTGSDVVKMSHWFLIWFAGLNVIVYISCINWWSQLR